MTRCSTLATTIGAIVLTLAAPSPTRAGQAPAETAPKISEKISEKAPVSGDVTKRQGYSVVLLLGDMKGPDAIDSVPSSAKKALADMKDFLPYRNYRLLDSQWTLCCTGATPAITRLRGPDDMEYELELRALPTLVPSNGEPPQLSMRFILRELADLSSTLSSKAPMHPDRIRELENKQALAAQAEAQAAEISREIFGLERERASLTQTVRNFEQAKIKLPPQEQENVRVQSESARAQLNLVAQRIDALRASLSAVPQTKGGLKAAMDASFRMTVGETVVVGTSGLRGGSRALIALLTAVDKKK